MLTRKNESSPWQQLDRVHENGLEPGVVRVEITHFCTFTVAEWVNKNSPFKIIDASHWNVLYRVTHMRDDSLGSRELGISNATGQAMTIVAVSTVWRDSFVTKLAATNTNVNAEVNREMTRLIGQGANQRHTFPLLNTAGIRLPLWDKVQSAFVIVATTEPATPQTVGHATVWATLELRGGKLLYVLPGLVNDALAPPYGQHDFTLKEGPTPVIVAAVLTPQPDAMPTAPGTPVR